MPEAHEIAHAGFRGAVGAMAMSGMRKVTVNLGLVEEPPPRAILRQKSQGLMRMIPRKKQKVAVELAHWGYGVVGGAAFGALPRELRRRAWAGPAYGLAVWLSFELGIGPLLGLKQSKSARPAERLALAADHLLYGLTLSEGRRRPQE